MWSVTVAKRTSLLTQLLMMEMAGPQLLKLASLGSGKTNCEWAAAGRERSCSSSVAPPSAPTARELKLRADGRTGMAATKGKVGWVV